MNDKKLNKCSFKAEEARISFSLSFGKNASGTFGESWGTLNFSLPLGSLPIFLLKFVKVCLCIPS